MFESDEPESLSARPTPRRRPYSHTLTQSYRLVCNDLVTSGRVGTDLSIQAAGSCRHAEVGDVRTSGQPRAG